MRKFILNIYGNFLIIVILALISGCASKDRARRAFMEGDYNTSYSIWKSWADRGYTDAYIKLLKIIDKTGKNVDYEKMKKMALDAYNAGEKSAAFVLEDMYIKEGNIDKAYQWMQRGDLALSSQRDFRNHLYIIKNYNIPFIEKKSFLQKIESLAQNNNLAAALALADFYADIENPLYDIKKSENFYKEAYRLGDEDAGIALAKLYIYNFNREREGLSILKSLSDRGNGRGSYVIGNFMLYKVNDILKKKNSSCIATSFNEPHEFFINKLYAQKSKRAYILNSVVPWYRKAYEQNYIDGMLRLISLDLEDNNFSHSEETYSKMNLKEAELFLQKHKENKKALKLLASLYQKHPELGKVNIAESIFLDSMEENSTQAMWSLYNLYKSNNINSKQTDAYLNELALEGFKPAIIEQSYKNILNSINVKQNLQILIQEADKGNIYALRAIVSLYNKDITKDIDYLPYLEKLCKLEYNNKTVDMKIADYYLKRNNLNKGATILQYYAQLGDSDAQYKLSKLYDQLKIDDKKIYWLQKAKDSGNIRAEIEYHTMVLEGLIQADVSKSLDVLNSYAKRGNIEAIRALAKAYATGGAVDFNPKAAKYYYIMILKNGDKSAYMDMINLYNKINIDHRYDGVLEQLYQKAIENRLPHAKVKYAQFLINRNRISEAKRILLTIPLEKEPLAKVLLYKITGNEYYLKRGKITNNGYLLLHYAQIISKYSKRKALLYAYRAYLCNTPSSGKLIYDLMRYINNSKIIKDIYEKAKSYPRCKNY